MCGGMNGVFNTKRYIERTNMERFGQRNEDVMLTLRTMQDLKPTMLRHGFTEHDLQDWQKNLRTHRSHTVYMDTKERNDTQKDSAS